MLHTLFMAIKLLPVAAWLKSVGSCLLQNNDLYAIYISFNIRQKSLYLGIKAKKQKKNKEKQNKKPSNNKKATDSK